MSDAYIKQGISVKVSVLSTGEDSGLPGMIHPFAWQHLVAIMRSKWTKMLELGCVGFNVVRLNRQVIALCCLNLQILLVVLQEPHRLAFMLVNAKNWLPLRPRHPGGSRNPRA